MEKTNDQTTPLLTDDLLNKVVRVEDNVPCDQSKINQLILRVKMAFLIFIMALGGKISSYLKSRGKAHVTIFGRPLVEKDYVARRIIFDLPRPLEIFDPETKNRFMVPAQEFYLAPSPDAPDEYRQTGPFRLRFKIPPKLWMEWRHCEYYDYDVICDMIHRSQIKFLQETDWFTLLQPITPYKGIGSTAHFFGVLPIPYAPYDKALGSMKPESFLPTDDHEYWANLKKANPALGEASLIETELRGIVNNTNPLFRDVYSARIEDSKQVFTFNDEYGYPVMKVIKRYDYKVTGTTKEYVPVTVWRHNGKPDNSYQVLPRSDKQILFNLDKIVNTDLIVFCPDLEIADALQKFDQDGDVAYTTLLCDVNSQVDISPVKKKSIRLLAINHSGLSLAEVYDDVQELYNFLIENMISDDIGVIQAEVVYPPAPRDFSSLAEQMSYHRSHKKPTIIPESIIELTDPEEIGEMFDRAEDEVIRKKLSVNDRQFWSEQDVESTEANTSEENVVKNEHIFYPFIARGAISYLAGESGIGKSNLIASIVAGTVNVSQRRPEIFPERCWSACKINNGYKRPKFLHLDFESGQGGIKKRERDFVDPYLPDDKNEREHCKANYIVKDLLNDSTNYAEEANFEDLCRMIDNAANEGEKGQPVDVLIIDTFQSFVHERDCDHWVLKTLLERYPNMAIVVLHHLEKGEFVGLKAKKRIAQATVYLTRVPKEKTDKDDKENIDQTHTATLHDPFTVQIKNLKLPHVLEDEEIFEAVFDEKSRFIVCHPTRTKAQMVRAIRDGFGDSISKKELANMLGMGEEKLDNYLSEAKNEKN